MLNAHNSCGRYAMGKKKETIQDVLDRINEDIETIREKVEELENHDCEEIDEEDED